MRKAREALVQSDSNLSLYYSKLFPSITGGLEASRQKAAAASSNPPFGGDPYNSYLAAISFQQPLYSSSVFGGIRFGKKELLIKQHQLQISERNLAASVLEAFYSVLLYEELLGILQDSLKVQKESLATSESYLRIGKIQKIDVLQQRTQVALITPRIAQMESQLKNSAAQLAGFLRDLDSSELRLSGALAPPDFDWVKRAASKRGSLPELEQIQEQISQFGDNRSIQLAPFSPSLSLNGKLQRSTYTKGDLLDSNTSSWNVTLQLSIPLFAGLGSIHQRKALASQEKQLELDQAKLSDSSFISEIQTRRALEVAKTQLDSSQQAATLGRESVKEAQRAYRLQTINYLQYQSSQQAYLDSESAFAQARFQFIVASAKYLAALGVSYDGLLEHLEALGKNPPKDR